MGGGGRREGWRDSGEDWRGCRRAVVVVVVGGGGRWMDSSS